MIIDVFCRRCGQYTGQRPFCIHCQADRPAASRFPLAGEAFWEQVLPSAPERGWQAMPGPGSLVAGPDRAGRFRALDIRTGADHWDPPPALPGRCSSQAAWLNDRLYLLLRDQPIIVAVDLDSGRLQTTALGPAGPANLTALASDGYALYVGNLSGRLARLQPAEGGALRLESVIPLGGVVRTPPCAWHHLLFAATVQGELQAWDWAQGRAAWDAPLALPLGTARAWPVMAGGRLHIITDGGYWLTLRPSDGQRAQPDRYLGARIHAAPLAAGDRLIVGAGDGRVLALDGAAGAMAWEPCVTGTAGVRALAATEHLLYAGTAGGRVAALDLARGTLLAERAWPARSIVGLAAAQDALLVAWRGQAPGGRPAEDGGLLGLPWHLGNWRAAYTWAAAQGWPAVAAPYAALLGEHQAAADLWLNSREPRYAGEMWWGLAEDAAAAEAFAQAARQVVREAPALAGGLYNRAADCYALVNEHAAEADCRRRAGRLGRFAALSIDTQPFNLGTLEVGLPGQLTVRIENRGSAPAEKVRFHAGGTLAEAVHGELPDVAPGQSLLVDIDNLVATAAGTQTLTLALTYQGAGSGDNYAPARFTLQVAPPPDIDIQDDAGGVILRLGPDERIPRIRVRGMAGMIKIQRTGS